MAARKVGGGGGLPGVVLHVLAHALAEGLLADPALEHGQHRAALGVGDRIEGPGDVVLGFDRLADLAGGDQAVGAHGSVARGHGADRALPLRLPLVDDLVPHPRGERLVEPDVVPPGQGDQVAEPLVGQLVRHHARVTALPAGGDLVRLLQKDAGRVGDQARVLHRPEEARQGDAVELAVRVGHAEVLLEPVQQGGDALFGVLGLAGAAPGDDDARRGVAAADPAEVDDLERTGGERDQVGRQRLGLTEGEGALAAFAGLLEHRGVGEGQILGRHGHGDLERHLEAGLVEAGEGAARRGRLELGVQIPLAPVLLPEDAVGVDVVDAAAVLDLDGDRPGRQLPRRLQADEVGRPGQDLERDGLARGGADGGPVDLEVVRVEPQRGGRPGQPGVDGDVAAEVGARGIDGEPGAIRHRLEGIGQTQGRRRLGGGRRLGRDGPLAGVAAAGGGHDQEREGQARVGHRREASAAPVATPAARADSRRQLPRAQVRGCQRPPKG
jgi:hypothetical protein